jgi:hypothetical protein
LANQEHGSRFSQSLDEAGPTSSSSLRGVRNRYLGRRALRQMQETSEQPVPRRMRRQAALAADVMASTHVIFHRHTQELSL